MTPDRDILIHNAQSGSREAREQLLKQYSPFILKTVSKVCGKFVRMGEDDEVSIGMIAFDEAVLSYCGKTGGGFLTYCELVIKHRLIDYFRKNNKNNKTLSLEDVNEQHLAGNDDIAKLIFREDLKQEIIKLSAELKVFDISFKDLVDNSPKHKDTRENVITAAMNIATNGKMINKIRQKKYLPQKDITENFNVSIKLLERFRKYIIAVCIIYSGNYSGLQAFIRGGEPHDSAQTGLRFGG